MAVWYLVLVMWGDGRAVTQVGPFTDQASCESAGMKVHTLNDFRTAHVCVPNTVTPPKS
jgi:hypothetical protein